MHERQVPLSSGVELVHRFPVVAGQTPPQATGLAFAKSGNRYVSLLGPNRVAVLDPAGSEIRRLTIRPRPGRLATTAAS